MSTSSPPRRARSCPPAAPRHPAAGARHGARHPGPATASVSAGQMLIELDRTVIAAERGRSPERSVRHAARRRAAHGAAWADAADPIGLCRRRRCAGRRGGAHPRRHGAQAAGQAAKLASLDQQIAQKSPKPNSSPPPSRSSLAAAAAPRADRRHQAQGPWRSSTATASPISRPSCG